MPNFMHWYNEHNITDAIMKVVAKCDTIGVVSLLKSAFDAGYAEAEEDVEDTIMGRQEGIERSE
jgi:hypothetical protein